MKTITKIALTLVVLSLLAGVMVFANAEPTLSIDMCNLSLRDNVCIKYAVTSDSSATTTLLVWDAPQSEYTYGTQTKELTTVGTQVVKEKTYKVYDYCDIAVKDMAKAVYARAYTKVGDTEYYSDVVKYSILKYAYNKLGKTGTATEDENLKNVLVEMLEYGASTQIYMEYNTDRLVTAPFYEIKTVGGTINDGCDWGLYLEGDSVAVTAPAEDENGVPFSGWVDGDGNAVASTANCTVTVPAKNTIYTATYKKTSVGLEIESNGDGTCCLISMGDCEDTDVIVPATYNGDTLTSIDSNAFSGEAITSITLPATIEEIGRRAFNNCDDLTDVYYEGTEEEWNEIDINATGNTALTGANIHFAKVTKYNVIFKDYNGDVISTQSVAKGEAATAPADPTRAGYTFTGWDTDFSNITADIVVTAQYEEITTEYTEPTFVVNNATAADGTVEVTVSMYKNPGIVSYGLTIEFDEDVLTLQDITYSSDFAATGAMTTAPTPYSSPQNLGMISPSSVIDYSGEICTLTFAVTDSAVEGDTEINISYNPENTTDANFIPVEFDTVNGKITIE